jgi:superfamily II DNA or RNA helicase
MYDDIAEAMARVRSVLAVCPTGGGKTVVFSSIMHDHAGATAAVVHRKEIVSQIACSLARLGVKHRVIAPPKTVAMIRRKQLKLYGRSFVDPHAMAGVVSVQTLTSRGSANNADLQQWIKQVTLAVWDEGHHYTDSGFWAKAVRGFGNARHLFVTATPKRADGRGLGTHADGFADEMIEGPSTRWLIEQGYLAQYSYFAPTTDLDVAGLAVTPSGDFNAKALRARVVDSHLVGDVISQYGQFAAGKRAIVFASDVATAEDIAGAFNAAGVPAAALSGVTDQAVREREQDRFERGDLLVLVNVDLFDEGYDVPAAECAILARPTQSLAKYLQMVGRVLRVIYAPGHDLETEAGRLAAIAAGPKPRAVIIDPVRNWERHGMLDWDRVWTLDGEEKGTRSAPSDTVPQRVCTSCSQPYQAFYAACPFCGAVPEPAGRSAPEQVDGDLAELDVAAMAALFNKIADADMDDAEYAVGQLARRIPAVGRGADMKRHRAAKYRRRVLRELVGWWVGMQPANRELSEKHRRFYLRFGIDIGTAFTLNTKDTDALIARVTAGFAKDMIA